MIPIRRPNAVSSLLQRIINGLGDTRQARVPISKRFALTFQPVLSQNGILGRFSRELVTTERCLDKGSSRMELRNKACQGIERLSQVSGSDRQMYPRVRAETRHRGSWAKSPLIYLNPAQSEARRF